MYFISFKVEAVVLWHVNKTWKNAHGCIAVIVVGTIAFYIYLIEKISFYSIMLNYQVLFY